MVMNSINSHMVMDGKAQILAFLTPTSMVLVQGGFVSYFQEVVILVSNFIRTYLC